MLNVKGNIMRENKFKVFDKITNEIYQVSELELEGTHHYCYNEELEYLHVITDNCILMQYTGLKDKNGVEIYEGDIIKLYGLPNAHFQVVFKNQYMGGWILMHKKNEVSLGALDKNKLKVVGNIYENPELLECNKDAKC